MINAAACSISNRFPTELSLNSVSTQNPVNNKSIEFFGKTLGLNTCASVDSQILSVPALLPSAAEFTNLRRNQKLHQETKKTPILLVLTEIE